MFELYTVEAIKVFMRAQDESRFYENTFMGTEHILLGLLADTGSRTERVLHHCGVTLDTARLEVEAISGRDYVPPQGISTTTTKSDRVIKVVHDIPRELPFSPNTRNVIQVAFDQAEARRHIYIAPEHILMAIIKTGPCAAHRVMDALGVNLSELESALERGFAPPSDNFDEFFDQAKQAQIVNLRAAAEDVRLSIEKMKASGEATEEAQEKLKDVECVLNFLTESKGSQNEDG